jgi:hypothetical protein
LARLENRWRRIESSNDLLGYESSSVGEETEEEAMGGAAGMAGRFYRLYLW